jgi:hypothetical protein
MELRLWKSLDKLNREKKKGKSYLQHTAQPGTFACFRTWRIKGSWLCKTFPRTKIVIFSVRSLFVRSISIKNMIHRD